MKLEFLSDGSNDCPLIRVYDFVPTEMARLFEAVSALATGRRQTVAVHELPGVQPVAGCRLFLRSGSSDKGLLPLSAPSDFECILSSDGWENVAGLLEPFLRENSGYQWLSSSGDANWLISSDGRW